MNKEILKTAKNINHVLINEDEWQTEFFEDYLITEVSNLIDLIMAEEKKDIELKIKELWGKGEIAHLGDRPDNADMQTLKVFADLEDVLECKQINWNHYWDRINWNKLTKEENV